MESPSPIQLLAWARQFPYASLLDSCGIPDRIGRFDRILAVGDEGIFMSSSQWPEAAQWLEERNTKWRFGILAYDLRTAFEKVPDHNPDHLALPDICFFEANRLIACRNGKWEVILGHESILKEIEDMPDESIPGHRELVFRSSTGRQAYAKGFQAIQRHLQAGNIYEINYCRQFLADDPFLKVEQTEHWYLALSKYNPAVQSGYFRAGNNVLMSSSPERFLQKNGRTLISEPIKGTAARSTEPIEDEHIKIELQLSEKERSENVMIVDLVRNDLSRLAVPGSVNVEELFSIRTLPHVHQMVSVVKAEMEAELDLHKLLQATFPMGSMTGAPKIAAMTYADELEDFRRSWYSGSLGYIDPHGNFDFNVLIRSLIANLSLGRVSLSAGGAITVNSREEDEFHETQVKALSVLKAIGAHVC